MNGFAIKQCEFRKEERVGGRKCKFSFRQVEPKKSLGHPGGQVLTLTLLLVSEEKLQS